MILKGPFQPKPFYDSGFAKRVVSFTNSSRILSAEFEVFVEVNYLRSPVITAEQTFGTQRGLVRKKGTNISAVPVAIGQGVIVLN